MRIEEEFENSQRIAQIGSWHWDVVNDRLISCSREYARIHGVSMDEIHQHLKTQMTDIVYQEDVERIMHVFKTSDEENKSYEVEYRIFHPNGEMRYVVECGEPVKTDGSLVLEQWGTVQDITERKLQEIERLKSEEELELAQQISNVGSYRMDFKTEVMISFSAQMAKIYGMNAEQISAMDDQYMEEVLHVEDRERVVAAYRAAKLNQTSGIGKTLFDIEYRIIRPDGEIRHIQELANVSKVSGGQVTELVGTMQDITERRLAEQALRKNRAQLQSILDFSPATISIKDMDSNYVVINKQMENLYNVTAEDAIGKNIKDVLPDDLIESACAQEKEVFETKKPSVWEQSFHIGDRAMTILSSRFLILDDEQQTAGIGVIATDVTELKQAEAALEKSQQELRDSEANFRAVVEQAGDAFFLIDTKTARFKQVNKQACKALGYSHDELLTLSVPDVDRAFPIEKFTNLVDSLAMGDPVTIETIIIRKDRTTFPAEIRTGLVETNAGAFLLALVRDVTERKQAEAELRILQQDLIRSERLATLGQLTATVSHELRNPLGAMRPSLYLLQKRLLTDDERLIAAFERLDRNIDRCDQIIDQMLDFTRIRGIDRQTLELDLWITKELDELEIPDGIDVKRDLGLTNQEFSFDPERLRRALINVYDNACQAMLENNAQATDAVDRQLLVKTQVNDNRIEIVVSDSGPGIPEDVLPRIFEPLYSTKGFGVGLGLATVQQALQQHDGDVEVLTTEGRGTSMVLWLPLPEERGVVA